MASSSGKKPIKLLALGELSNFIPWLAYSLTLILLERRRRHSWTFRAAHNQTNYAQDHGRRERQIGAERSNAPYSSAQAM